MVYDHKFIEKKWQDFWEKKGSFVVTEDKTKEKAYLLIEFPYPSGEGLHVGHPRSYTAMDVLARKRRMDGQNVLFPIGFDAFGLPAENYAIKTGQHPTIITEKNIANFRRQLKSLGYSFDWSREVVTTDPSYYKWTQWIFLKLFEKGLAYKLKMPINWCPSCKIGLAHEEVVDGKCERCGTKVEQKEKEQWMLKITAYAERLIDDLDTVDYLPRIKTQQVNWIGKSEGHNVNFKITDCKLNINIFTTRLDTIFGATYLVLAPEHELIQKLRDKIKNFVVVKEYIDKASKKTELERKAEEKEKTGVILEGVEAVNPVNSETIPVFVADYVLLGYGTGAIMAVPAHDTRDFAFAKKFNLGIKCVIDPVEAEEQKDAHKGDRVYIDYGRLINSSEFNGLSSEEAIKKIAKKFGAEKKVQYKLRDWVFSRQRYWGEPIPMVDCQKCGWVPVPEKDLPIELPQVEKYEPTDTGESPLATMTDWVKTVCPKCNGEAKRETDTMPNWAGSSWYFLRYTDPKNNKALADPKKLKYWTPVDWYNGGMEHTTLHLLYSRFWHKFLFDIGIVPTSEPYAKRTSHGMILGESGEKMSKSRGNIVNPDEVVATYGADTLRTYELFIGPFADAVPWSTQGLVGVRRFLDRVWYLVNEPTGGNTTNATPNEIKELKNIISKTIKKVGEGIETFNFNTAIASMMELVNYLYSIRTISTPIKKETLQSLLLVLYPFAPHLVSELWEQKISKTSILLESWPKYNEADLVVDSIVVPIQINGKLRGTINTSPTTAEEELIELAKAEPNVVKWIQGKQIIKTVVKIGKFVNLVVKE